MAKPTKQDESLTRRLNYEYPYFESYVQPHGALVIDRACHACFYYAMLATKARQNAGDIESQTIQYKVGEEVPLWREPRDHELAVSVAILYQLPSPDSFLRYKKEAWVQCQQIGVTVDPKIFEITSRKGLIH